MILWLLNVFISVNVTKSRSFGKKKVKSSQTENQLTNEMKVESDTQSKFSPVKFSVRAKTRLYECSKMEPEFCREHLYRIPSLLITEDNSILAFASKRKKNLTGRDIIRDWNHETDNVVRRSIDKGYSFSEDIVIASFPCVDIHRGPVLYDRANDTVYSFMRYSPAVKQMFGVAPHTYSESKSIKEMREDKIYRDAKCDPAKRGNPGSKGENVSMGDYVSFSKDQGQNWSTPIPINLPYPEGATGAGFANGSHGIQLSNGRFVIQARYKFNGEQHRTLFYSDKKSKLHKGKNWVRGAIIVPNKVKVGNKKKPLNMSKQEFTIAESPQNVVLANFRTGEKSGKGRVQARIENATKVIQDPHHVEALRAPNVHGALLRKSDQFDDYLFSIVASKFDRNDVSESKAESRKGLILYRSNDGDTWSQKSIIHKQERPTGYSDMDLFNGGSQKHIGLLFEAGKVCDKNDTQCWEEYDACKEEDCDKFSDINYRFMYFKRLRLKKFKSSKNSNNSKEAKKSKDSKKSKKSKKSKQSKKSKKSKKSKN